jgi:hypothetical protein
VAVIARPFMTISVAAEYRFCGRAAEELWGAALWMRAGPRWEPRAAELGRSRLNWAATWSAQQREGLARQVLQRQATGLPGGAR